MKLISAYVRLINWSIVLFIQTTILLSGKCIVLLAKLSSEG